MDTRDMLARLRRVEIRARGLTNEVFAGEYHSAFKGRGMAFSEVREYRFGDDVRNIDWNVTARFNAPYVKVYEEERELTVMLVVDVSGSRVFGTESMSVKNVMTEMAAVLAFSTIHNNDKVGVLFFSDRVEKFIPPKKGRKHVLRIIWELMSFEPVGRGTDVSVALRYLTNAIKRRCTAFVLSDFIDFEGGEPRFSEAVKIAANRHDLVAFRVHDPREESLPDVGLLRLYDAESGVARWVNTSSRRVREAYAAAAVEREQALRRVFSKSGVDWASVSTARDYVQPMLKLFKQRA